MAKIEKTITRLLSERKTLEQRIQTATAAKFIDLQKGEGDQATVPEVSGKTVKDQTALINSNYDTVVGLIAYHHNITAAIIKSNAETMVKIGDKNMTVAEAIERKKSIRFSTTLTHQMRQQYTKAQNTVEAENQKLDARIDAQVAQTLSSDKSKVTSEQIKALRPGVADPLNKTSRYTVIDPKDLGKIVVDRSEEETLFLSEVDFVLSESNAKTVIEVDDGTPEPVATSPSPAPTTA